VSWIGIIRDLQVPHLIFWSFRIFGQLTEIGRTVYNMLQWKFCLDRVIWATGWVSLGSCSFRSLVDRFLGFFHSGKTTPELKITSRRYNFQVSGACLPTRMEFKFRESFDGELLQG
jgi:hypothetical protein